MTSTGLEETTIFDARLRPHRSLSPRGFRALMIIVGAATTCASLPFYLLHAWPVVGFFGLDVALLYAAFRMSYRQARAYEDLRLTYVELLFARVAANGAKREWRFNPSWVRLERVDHAEFGLQSLSLISRGSRWEVGGFLGPEERGELASRLGTALAEARRGPRFSD